MIDLNAKKELFSVAYMHAITAKVGLMTSRRQLDRDGVDWNVSSAEVGRWPRRPQIELQLKASADDELTTTELRFPLPIANYHQLRAEPLVVPRILLVVRIPNEEDDWLTFSEDELVLRRCGYWANLRGAPRTENTASVTVSLPRANVFDPPTLEAIMTRIDGGGEP